MHTVSARLTRYLKLSIGVSALALVWTGSTMAQVSTSAPKTTSALQPEATDKNGVNLATQGISFGSPFGLGGPATSRLSMRNIANGWSFTSTLKPTLREQTLGTSLYGYQWLVTTDAGGPTRRFLCEYNDTVANEYYCSSFMGDGTELVVSQFTYHSSTYRADPKEYIFYDKDGTTYVFKSLAIQLATAMASGSGTYEYVQYPSGEKLTGGLSSNLGYGISQNVVYGSGTASVTYGLTKAGTTLQTLSAYETYNSSTSTVTETDALGRTFTSNWTLNSSCGNRATSYTQPGGLQTGITYASTTPDNLYGNYRSAPSPATV